MTIYVKHCLLIACTMALAACGSSNSSESSGDVASLAFESQLSEIPSFQTQNNEESEACGQNEFDQELLNAINVIRSEGRQCGSETFIATNPVVWNCQLEDAAYSHSSDMATNNFFSHSGSDGLRVNNRVDETGYQWSKVAENIAAGYPGIDLVLNAWLESPSHCATLMGSDYEEVGVFVELTEDADYNDYWTLVMGQAVN